MQRNRQLELLNESQTYRWHRNLALEAPPDSVVDALWLSPIRRHTFVQIALMAPEALGAY
jgi:hypothetical protein